MVNTQNALVGNAVEDGGDFGSWFVGDLKEWSDIPFKDFGLRQSARVECKFQHHKKGERRADGWSCDSSKRTLTILIHGLVLVRFRDENGDTCEKRLTRGGDYVIWIYLSHDWVIEEDSTVLTVRWVE